MEIITANLKIKLCFERTQQNLFISKWFLFAQSYNKDMKVPRLLKNLQHNHIKKQNYINRENKKKKFFFLKNLFFFLKKLNT